MSKRFARILCAALICALAMASLPTLATSISVKLNTSAKIYQKASTSSRSVKAPKNLRVTLKAYKSGWARISYRGHTGYIKLKYLDRTIPIKAYVRSSSTVYRSAGSGRLGTAGKGAVVYVIGVNGSYAHIQNKSGTRKGYIKVSALSARRVSASSGSSSGALPSALKSKGGSNAENVIYLAQKLLGRPYSSDANPPKTFDCARFVYYCYNSVKSGTVKGSAKSQGYDSRYTRIAYSDLKRGDLVVFNTVEDGDLSDHVGIYLGSGYFIHASSAASQVIVSSLKSGYYKRNFSWGLRVL